MTEKLPLENRFRVAPPKQAGDSWLILDDQTGKNYELVEGGGCTEIGTGKSMDRFYRHGFSCCPGGHYSCRGGNE